MGGGSPPDGVHANQPVSMKSATWSALADDPKNVA